MAAVLDQLKCRSGDGRVRSHGRGLVGRGRPSPHGLATHRRAVPCRSCHRAPLGPERCGRVSGQNARPRGAGRSGPAVLQPPRLPTTPGIRRTHASFHIGSLSTLGTGDAADAALLSLRPPAVDARGTLKSTVSRPRRSPLTSPSHRRSGAISASPPDRRYLPMPLPSPWDLRQRVGRRPPHSGSPLCCRSCPNRTSPACDGDPVPSVRAPVAARADCRAAVSVSAATLLSRSIFQVGPCRFLRPPIGYHCSAVWVREQSAVGGTRALA
ncbi:Uncharacterised protein [Nocardia brasiliensis]|nr:Uncharacterised protein [Nocardia brasiliensis]